MKTSVLLIEDDPMVCEVNRQFIERVKDFVIVATAKNGKEGIEKIKQLHPDLVFMDIYMPEKNGLDMLMKLRASKLDFDVIAVTAANDAGTIQTCFRLGVCDYIMKPFTYERIEMALVHYKQRREHFKMKQSFSQKELDAILYPNTTEAPITEDDYMFDDLPKGFNKSTLLKVLTFLKNSQAGASADEVAASIGVARVTARRYLDYMEKQRLIQVDIQYGSVGRPINQYFIRE